MIVKKKKIIPVSTCLLEKDSPRRNPPKERTFRRKGKRETCSTTAVKEEGEREDLSELRREGSDLEEEGGKNEYVCTRRKKVRR